MGMGMGMGVMCWGPNRGEGANAKVKGWRAGMKAREKCKEGGERALIVCGRNAQGLAHTPGDSWP